ncbi:MAG: ATP-binding cassette domain-containing protein, partial [Chloroflexota bacterium]
DNMAFGLKLRKTPKDEIDSRVQLAATDLGITDLLARKPKQLSGGQRQRVAVGRAIVRDPAVFLMDEPLSNLDAKLRVEARAMIGRLHNRLETTFIYVTHDQTEAMTMGTRIAVMKDGLLMQIASPQVLYDTPDNVFVAGFIGSPSMNFFDATLVAEDGRMMVDAGIFRVEVPAAKASAYQQHVGKSVVFGIRPEDIHDPDYLPSNITAAGVSAEVEVTELMGNEVFVYYNTAGTTYIGRVDPRTSARVGSATPAVFNMDNMHIFDRETEAALR